jgi:hypothetical protein
MKVDEARLIAEENKAKNKLLEDKKELERIEKLREVYVKLMEGVYGQIINLAKIGKSRTTVHADIYSERAVIDILRADGYTVTTGNFGGIRVSWE